MTPACVIYARISDDATSEGLGVERQVKDCWDLANRRGWKVVGKYVDNDLSGFKATRRPMFEALLARLDVPEVERPIVVAYGQDRLARSVTQLERLLATGAQVVCLKSGDIDSTTPQGRLVARMLGAVAQGFSENMSADLRRKNAAKAMAGVPRTEGGRRFGYTLAFEQLPDEAKAIRAAAKTLIAGGSVNAVARDWRDRGITSPVGKPYAATSLRRMLCRAYLSGRREHLGEVVAVGNWKPILDVATHETLTLVLNNPARSNYTSDRAGYALTGTLSCASCGARLYGTIRNERRVYRCKVTHAHPHACSGVSIGADDLEGYVRQRIADRITQDGKRISKRMTKPDTAPKHSQLAACRARQTEAEDAYASGEIAKAAYLRIAAKLDAQIGQLEDELRQQASTNRLATLPATEAEAFKLWDRDAKTLVAALVASIEVRPATRRGSPTFESGRVHLAWTEAAKPQGRAANR